MRTPRPVPTSPADAEVDHLLRYREGDANAFRLLVDAYRDRMLQFFYRLCWDRDRAEDLAQDLFVKLMLASKRYRPEGRLSTFVYRVATNLWIDHYRQQRPRPRFQSLDQVVLPGDDTPTTVDVAGPTTTPPEQLGSGEEKAAMKQAMERLTEPHRLVFELAVYQERPYGEISELLGIPVGTVKSRMHNAVSALKQMLGHLQPAPAERPATANPRPRIGGVG
ncbi:MAG: RNA polymerase sigma factor [Planctomycetes bacterium]|nr:RNA polymerase sigma factor [Planctomycetota bacterium]